MNYKLRNEEKMRKYLSKRACVNSVTDIDFQDTIDYFLLAIDFIEETRDGKPKPREGACLTAIIDEEDIEVWVIFDYIVENNEEIVVIDFDYNYDDYANNLML